MREGWREKERENEEENEEETWEGWREKEKENENEEETLEGYSSIVLISFLEINIHKLNSLFERYIGLGLS